MCVHRESGAQRAVKVLRKSHMDEEEKRMLFNEINILREIVSRPFFSVNTLFSSHMSSDCHLGPPQYREDVRILRGRQAVLPCDRVSFHRTLTCKGSAREVNCSTKFSNAASLARKMPLF
jgi:hypothetical protein